MPAGAQAARQLVRAPAAAAADRRKRVGRQQNVHQRCISIEISVEIESRLNSRSESLQRGVERGAMRGPAESLDRPRPRRGSPIVARRAGSARLSSASASAVGPGAIVQQPAGGWLDHGPQPRRCPGPRPAGRRPCIRRPSAATSRTPTTAVRCASMSNGATPMCAAARQPGISSCGTRADQCDVSSPAASPAPPPPAARAHRRSAPPEIAAPARVQLLHRSHEMHGAVPGAEGAGEDDDDVGRVAGEWRRAAAHRAGNRRVRAPFDFHARGRPATPRRQISRVGVTMRSAMAALPLAPAPHRFRDQQPIEQMLCGDPG